MTSFAAKESQQVGDLSGNSSGVNVINENLNNMEDEMKEQPSDSGKPKGPFVGMRHIQALLIFLNIIVMFIGRLNIGVAVVAMTHAATTNPNYPEFNWNEQEISYIFSSFYWGYVVTQFPGGVLCRRFGAKITLATAAIGSLAMSILTPWSVTWGGWQAFAAIRLGQGLFQAVMFPCIHQHLAKWSPLQELNRLAAFSYTGIDIGTAMAMAITGLIAKSSMGWPGISYVSAGLCMVWCVMWLIFGANSPKESKFITETEKLYIESASHYEDHPQGKKIPVPWKAISTSGPFIATLIARGASSWSVTTLQTQIPSYLNGVLEMEIKSNALFSALPFLATWIMAYVFIVIADVLQAWNVLSLTAIRKSFNSIGFWVPAACLIAIGFLGKDNTSLAVTLMTLNVAAISGGTIGSAFNNIDLSPNHAGVLMGIINTVASLMSLISPLVVGLVITDTGNRSQWQIVFAISAAFYFFGNSFFVIFGSTSIQPWDAADYLSSKDAENTGNHEVQGEGGAKTKGIMAEKYTKVL